MQDESVPITPALLRGWPLPQPGDHADKESRGRLLVIAGSRELPGAALLCVRAALRAGAGKVTLATPQGIAAGLALMLPEARVIALPELASGGVDPAGLAALDDVAARAQALLVGPGLHDAERCADWLPPLLQRSEAAVVLDALAMDMLHRQPRFDRPPLLTPHAGELAHLSGEDKMQLQADPEAASRRWAQRWNAVVALKGATTCIAEPGGRLWRHDGGNVGLAVSGSGDVLAGVIAGLAARGAPLSQAAAWGVALHAQAGEALARVHGPIGYLPSELADEVPCLMNRLMNRLGEPPPAPDAAR